MGNLYQAPPGTFRGAGPRGVNTLPIADLAPITIGGHKAYGVYIMPGMVLCNNNATGLAIEDEPQGIYMVFDGTHYSSDVTSTVIRNQCGNGHKPGLYP